MKTKTQKSGAGAKQGSSKQGGRGQQGGNPQRGGGSQPGSKQGGTQHRRKQGEEEK
jgi:hypothetical protein